MQTISHLPIASVMRNNAWVVYDLIEIGRAAEIEHAIDAITIQSKELLAWQLVWVTAIGEYGILGMVASSIMVPNGSEGYYRDVMRVCWGWESQFVYCLAARHVGHQTAAGDLSWSMPRLRNAFERTVAAGQE